MDLIQDIHHRAVETGQSAIAIALVTGTRTTHIRPTERIVYVPRHPPRITHRLRPIPRRILPPIAQRIQNGPSRLIQRLRHHIIPAIRQHRIPRLPAIIAIIIFQIIHAPAREGPRILRFIPEGAGVLAAGVEAGGAVHAEFQPQGVDPIRDGLHAGGEFRGGGEEGAVGGAA